MMRSRASFHPDQAWWHGAEECQHLASAKGSAQHNLTALIDAMKLENVLCYIETDGGNFVHSGWLLSQVLQ
jgi:hypothetical protein